MTNSGRPIVTSANGRRLACRSREGTGPTLLFLPGYASDMEGAKALALDDFAARRGIGLVRFDYSGTGCSPGRFEDGTLDAWLEDTLAIVEQQTAGPLVLVGSSMGGWIALHVALQRPDRVAGLVGIAAAPDFTEWGFSAEDKARLLETGRLERANPHGGEAQLTTAGFWRSGQHLRLLDGPVDVGCPVRLIHGEADADVPVDIALRLMRQLRSADVQLQIIKGAGHRLSEPREIDTILRTVSALLESLC